MIDSYHPEHCCMAHSDASRQDVLMCWMLERTGCHTWISISRARCLHPGKRIAGCRLSGCTTRRPCLQVVASHQKQHPDMRRQAADSKTTDRQRWRAHRGSYQGSRSEKTTRGLHRDTSKRSDLQLARKRTWCDVTDASSKCDVSNHCKLQRHTA